MHTTNSGASSSTRKIPRVEYEYGKTARQPPRTECWDTSIVDCFISLPVLLKSTTASQTRHLVKYMSRYRWGRELQSSGGINVMVVGQSQVGKTSIIKKLIKNVETKRFKRVKNMYEYREEILSGELDESIPASPVSTSYRRKAIEIGDIFVAVFAIDDQSSFEYIAKLREEIFEIKGETVPLIVVGNKSDLRKKSKQTDKHVSFAFADLVVSLDWEATYTEVSAKVKYDTERLLDDIIKKELTVAKANF